MSGLAETSSHELNSDTCDISPTHNDCRKAEPGGSPAKSTSSRQHQQTGMWRRQPYRPRHRPARVGRGFLQLSIYGWFGTEARISLALACPRINRRRPPRGMGAGCFVWATSSRPHAAVALAELKPVRDPRAACLLAQIV